LPPGFVHCVSNVAVQVSVAVPVPWPRPANVKSVVLQEVAVAVIVGAGPWKCTPDVVDFGANTFVGTSISIEAKAIAIIAVAVYVFENLLLISPLVQIFYKRIVC